MRLTLPHVVLVGVLVVGVSGGAAAVAAIPGGDGKISACYSNADGKVRLIDPQAGSGIGRSCLPGETLTSWSHTGPKGATGPQGPQGPPGPSFVRAAYSPDNDHRGPSKLLASIDLPANSFFSAAADADTYRQGDWSDPSEASVSCWLKVKRASGQFENLDGAHWSYEAGEEFADGQLDMRSVVATGAGTDKLQVWCSTGTEEDDFPEDDRPWVADVKLEALQVGGYHLHVY